MLDLSFCFFETFFIFTRNLILKTKSFLKIFVYLSGSGLSCSTGDRRCIMRAVSLQRGDSSCGGWPQQLQFTGLVALQHVRS